MGLSVPTEATVSVIEILKLYSLPTSLAIVAIVTSAAALALRHTIQKTIDASFRKIELELARRSAFIETVYNQRFSLVLEISKKLERVRSDIDRLVGGRATNDEIAPKGELKGLTEIHEDLRVIRVVLGAELGSLLESKAALASIVASRWEELRGNRGEYERHLREWSEINDRLFVAVAKVFDFPPDDGPQENHRIAVRRLATRGK
jgi:hypothetical protein